MGSNVYLITTVLKYALYVIKLTISSTNITKSPGINYQCYGLQGYDAITIQDSIFTNTQHYGYNLISVNTKNCVNEYKGNKKCNQ